jgi:hypothetical protein
MRTAIVITPDPAPAWALELIAEVRALRIALAPQLRSSIDGDAEIGRALVELDAWPLTCTEMLALPDAALQRALAVALIDDAAQLGQCLSRLRHRGLIDREPRRSSHGWRWTAVTG